MKRINTSTRVGVAGLRSGPLGRKRWCLAMRRTSTFTVAAALGAGWAYIAVGTAVAAPSTSGVMYGKQQVLAFSGLVEPYGVAVDGAGNVYTSDLNTREVYKLSPAGFQTTLTGLTSLLHIPDASRAAAIGLAADAGGDIFVADYAHASVYELKNGMTIPVPLPLGGAAAPAGLAAQGPTGVAVDTKGDVFASYYGGQVWELAHGTAVPVKLPFDVVNGMKTMDGSGAGHPYYNVATDAAGDAFVTGTNNATIYEVKKGASTATPVFSVGYFTTAVAVDSAGDVFATDNNDFTVKERRADGTHATLPITLLAGPPSIPLPTPVSIGKLTGYGLAVDATGDVFVTALDHQHVIELPQYTCSAPARRPRTPRRPSVHHGVRTHGGATVTPK